MRTALLGATCGGALVLGAATALGATTGSGSSFARVAYQNWCQSLGSCSYASTGSGAGLAALGAKTVDFAGSDAIPTPDQLSKIQAAGGGTQPLFFPTLLGGISVPVNVSGLKGRLRFDGNTLGRIFDGEITTWNDPAIKKQNPGVKLPSSPITVCVRSDASGTSFGFSRYLTKVSPSFKAKVNFSQTPPWTAPNLQKGPQNPGVANCIKSNSNSIGYVDLADANNAGLAGQVSAIGKSQVVKVKVKKKGKTTTVSQRKVVYIVPNGKSISLAGNLPSYPANLLVDPSASNVPGAYPIVITTWVVAYGNYSAAGKDLAGVKQFLNYAYSKGQSQLLGLGYAPLPDRLLTSGMKQIAKLK
jgi:phosphate transport system substrate-binding protein